MTGTNFLPKYLMFCLNVLKCEESNDHSARFYSQVPNEASPVVFSLLEQHTKYDQHLGDSAGARFGHFLQLLLYFFTYSQSSPGKFSGEMFNCHPIAPAAESINTISGKRTHGRPCLDTG